MDTAWTLLDFLQQPYFQRAMMAAIMAGAACALLGCFMVLRNMALIGDALSHAILPGVVVGFMVAGHSLIAFFLGSVGAGLVAAVLIAWLQGKGGARNDAAIGIVFSAMFALGVMGISALSRREGVHLDMKDFLFGNVLGIGREDLLLVGLVLAFDVLCIVLLLPYFFATAFQSDVAQTMGIPTRALHYFSIWMLSLTVVASLQTVGVILVVSMLIIPASTALIISNKLRNVLIWSVLLGAFASGWGMLASVYWDTAPGPAITLSSTALYVMVLLGHPVRGLWPRMVRRKLRLVRHWAEDMVKLLIKKPEISKEQLRAELRWSAFTYRIAYLWCRRLGWIQKNRSEHGGCSLTQQGETKALQLVRAHRLWESYLAQKQGFEPHQLHWLAEKDEHYLPQDFLDQIDRRLGFPDLDPHGSPIPRGMVTQPKKPSSSPPAP
jgi:ABC-type Mn2+/Zn2+ transport system permease subunit/Mn-dependent DtxR family transcriptional regulator